MHGQSLIHEYDGKRMGRKNKEFDRLINMLHTNNKQHNFEVTTHGQNGVIRTIRTHRL